MLKNFLTTHELNGGNCFRLVRLSPSEFGKKLVCEIFCSTIKHQAWRRNLHLSLRSISLARNNNLDWSLRKDDIVYGPSPELVTLSDLQYSKIIKIYEGMFSLVDIAVPRHYKKIEEICYVGRSH